jgi:stress response protein YsnF
MKTFGLTAKEESALPIRRDEVVVERMAMPEWFGDENRSSLSSVYAVRR